MGILDKLFKSDPTVDWPAGGGKAPVLDLEGLGVGSIRLGDPFEKARAFGRPVRFAQRAEGEGKQFLEYDGFDLEFDGGALVCVEVHLYDGGEVRVSGFTLTSATTQADLRAWLGEPTEESTREDIVWLSYERNGASLDLEFEDEGLASVQFYREGWA